MQYSFFGKPQDSLAISAAGITLLLSLLIITPLCGLLFQCGCDWPWSGLDKHCNYYQAGAEQRCPWCDEIIVGFLACATAIVTGTVVAYTVRFQWVRHGYAMVCRIIAGIVIFAVVALFVALLAAWGQGYEQGIGMWLH